MKPDLRQIVHQGGEGWLLEVPDSRCLGREWVAKVGKEAQSETAAVRLVWAAGYETEVNYLVPRLTIPGKGTFQMSGLRLAQIRRRLAEEMD